MNGECLLTIWKIGTKWTSQDRNNMSTFGNFWWKEAKWPTFGQCWQILTNMRWNFGGTTVNLCEKIEFGTVQKCANLGNLNICYKMSIYLHNLFRHSQERALLSYFVIFSHSSHFEVQIQYIRVNFRACWAYQSKDIFSGVNLFLQLVAFFKDDHKRKWS